MPLFPWRSRTRAETPSEAQERAQADATIAEGHRLEDAGDVHGARRHYEAAAALTPDYWRAHLNLGNAFRLQASPEEAIRCYRRAIELAPDQAAAHLNLGNALMDAGRSAEAAHSYLAAASLRVDWSAPLLGYASAVAQADPADAEKALRTALAIEPTSGTIAARLALLLEKSGRDRDAMRVLDDTLACAPDDHAALVARAAACTSSGDAAGAVDAYREALRARPSHWETWSAYLFAASLLPEIGADELIAEHFRFGERIAESLPPRAEPSRGGADKRLRIAYLSPDFRAHPVANFIAPVLRHHDHAHFDIHCFHLDARADPITAELRSRAPRWHEVHGLADDVLERRLRDNGIDILVDLTGHTSGNRLPVLARKPAPLQFTWLGYLGTTGLATMDVRICDAITDPTGSPAGCERVATLPYAQWCYEPLRPLPAVSDLPHRRNGHWTFGSFNQGSKLNRPTLVRWADTLARIPRSRLRMFGVERSMLADTIVEVFDAAGIDRDRVDIVGRLPITDYIDAFKDVDVAFDTHPYSGATTTCDALIMGVPVVTVIGERGVTRSTASLLTACGLGEWIAPSPDDFADTLLARIADEGAVATLRAGLREHLQGSPVMDGAGFTRALESLFRDAWREHIGA